MTISRKQFLIQSGLATAGILAGNSLFAESSAKKIKKFGIQLYSLRDVLPKDPKGILTQLAQFGYKQIESYEGPDGMFWGMGATGFRQLMNQLGMTIVASHFDFRKNLEQKAADAASIGMKYLICPHIGEQKKPDDYKRIAEDFNKAGEVCKKTGLRFAYHNHAYSFTAKDGQFPQDILMMNTDPALVDFEMDMYWVTVAGQDPIAWMDKYKNRFKLCHVKDREKGSNNKPVTCTLGKGDIDYKSIVKKAMKRNMGYFIIEQEHYNGTNSTDGAKDSAAYFNASLR